MLLVYPMIEGSAQTTIGSCYKNNTEARVHAQSHGHGLYIVSVFWEFDHRERTLQTGLLKVRSKLSQEVWVAVEIFQTLDSTPQEWRF